jgi:poly-gamma-glutamate synthesis protein (capsule biosynthesis protein)
MRVGRFLMPSLAAALVILGGCNRVQPIPLTSYPDPYGGPEQFMQGIYRADHDVDPPGMTYPIRAVIVPHHLTATIDIAAGIRMLRGQHFTKILLMSPDHFYHCPTLVCAVNARYETQFGIVQSDPRTVEVLAASPLVTVNPDLFKMEHGIYAVLPYIAHYFPGVAVTPVALSQNAWMASSGALLDLIASQADSGTVLIVSSDFSHYLPLAKADANDEKTAEALFSADLGGIAHLENPAQSDCPNCLWTLASLAKQRGFYNPSVIYHTNSARILNDLTVTSTTSHFAMVWYQNATLDASDFAAAGDVTLTRTTKPPALPADMQAFWAGTGVRLVNLEGPLSDHCARDRSMFDFCNSLSLFQGIQSLATHWGIMNNHALDQYLIGVDDTVRLLTESHEIPVTDTFVESGGVRMIALTALMNPVADSTSIGPSEEQQKVLDALRHLPKDGRLTVVFVHAGTEYQALTDPSVRLYLESFINAGADAVIATHTHVQSDMFLYKGKPIFEGIGNFFFDQHDTVATSTAKIVRLRKAGDSILFETFMGRT